MTRWEYAVRSGLDTSSLNSMGHQGWEAVGLTQQFTTTWILFKRSLPEASVTATPAGKGETG